MARKSLYHRRILLDIERTISHTPLLVCRQSEPEVIISPILSEPAEGKDKYAISARGVNAMSSFTAFSDHGAGVLSEGVVGLSKSALYEAFKKVIRIYGHIYPFGSHALGRKEIFSPSADRVSEHPLVSRGRKCSCGEIKTPSILGSSTAPLVHNQTMGYCIPCT